MSSTVKKIPPSSTGSARPSISPGPSPRGPSEQAKLEERLHENDGTIENLMADRKESSRQRRDTERTHEAERAAMSRERDEMATREEQMLGTIDRLKERLAAQRDVRDGMDDEGRMRGAGTVPLRDGTVCHAHTTQELLR